MNFELKRGNAWVGLEIKKWHLISKVIKSNSSNRDGTKKLEKYFTFLIKNS